MRVALYVFIVVALIISLTALYLVMQPGLGQRPAPYSTSAAQTASPAQGETTRTVAVGSVSSSTTTSLQPRPQFDAKDYEVNYTVRASISLAGITVRVQGWSLEGAGPLGNYSEGLLTYETSQQTWRYMYKSATEGSVQYWLQCTDSNCTRSTTPAYGSLFRLPAGKTTETGTCTHLGFQGVSDQEEGEIPQDVLTIMLGGTPTQGPGSYTAASCLVKGVPLLMSGVVRFTAVLNGQPVYVVMQLDLVATSAGPYSAERYKAILSEVKAR